MEKKPLIDRIRKLTSPIMPESISHDTDLKTLRDIHCVAFDFYGTMFLSGAGDIGVDESGQNTNKRRFLDALEYIGFKPPDEDSTAKAGIQQFQQIIKDHIDKKKAEEGIDYPEPDIIAVWEEVLVFMRQRHLIEEPVTRQQAVRLAVEYEFRTNSVWPTPDLDIILREILNKSCKLGIISNSQFYTPLAFEALIGQSTDDFGFDTDLQKWSYVNGVKKPSLRFYKKFVDELPAKGISPESVLYVGNDLFKDILPATELNMKTALYVGDRRSIRHEKADLSQPNQHPDLIIDDLHQLLECLG
jgi:putative hydrolase of the HAD superfamily